MMTVPQISTPVPLPAGFVTYVVNVHELVLPICLGIYEHEINNLQPVSINIDIFFAAPRVDDSKGLDQVICYDVIIEKVRALSRQSHVFLVETFVDRIADLCLSYPGSYFVNIAASKTKIHEGIGRVGITAQRFQDTDVFAKYVEQKSAEAA